MTGGGGAPSHGRRGVQLFRPVVDDVLQLSGIRHVVAGFVLGQDLHQRAQLQPPLLFRDPVPGDSGASSDLCGRLIHDLPTYTKSVSSFSCTTGWKTRALRRIPSRQQESSLFANTRPAGVTTMASADGHTGRGRKEGQRTDGCGR